MDTLILEYLALPSSGVAGKALQEIEVLAFRC
jgi:hypothetical protein